MNRIGWILYGLCVIFLVIKLIMIGWQQYNLYSVAYSGTEFTSELMFDLVVVRGFFIEPLLILISLIGFALRNKIGLTLATVFPYFIITNMLHNLTPINLYFATSDIAQLFFALLILLPLNYKKTITIFISDWTLKRQILINVSTLVFGILVNLLYQSIINSYQY